MSNKKSDPPGLAIWLLQRLYRVNNNEALTGDLIEEYRKRRSRGWFWKQVLIAIATGVLAGMSRHWPHVCYAMTGAALAVFAGKILFDARAFVPWWILPWPWSMLVFDLSPSALLSLAALPVLAAGLQVNGVFRRASLLRTWIIGLPLLALSHYLLEAFRLPLVLPRTNLAVIVPAVCSFVVQFFVLLVSSWLGCRSPRHAAPVKMRTVS